MPISVTCTSCGARIKAPDRTAGSKIACPKCDRGVLVPDPDDKPASKPPATRSGYSPSSPAKRHSPQPDPYDFDDDEDETPRKRHSSRRQGESKEAEPSRAEGSTVGRAIGWGFGLTLGYMIAGTVIPLVLCCGGFSIFFLVPAISKVADADSRVRGKGGDPRPEADPPPVADEPAPKQPTALDALAESAKVGDAEIRVVSARQGKVELTGIRGDGRSNEELLIVRVSIRNRSATKKLNYHGWAASAADFAATGRASVTDNFGNSYKRIHFGFGERVKGQKASESIYPGEAIEDVLIFERPVSSIEHLLLTLPMETTGESGLVKFRIPWTAPVKR